MLVAIIIILSFGYGLAIGANDAANSFADWIGARVGRVMTGMFLCGGFALLGAIVEGGKVSKTIGKGIVSPEYLTVEVAMIGIIGAILWVFLATYFGMPISTTHSIVGGVAGLGMAMAVPVNWIILKKIVICWFATPTGACLIAIFIFTFLIFIIKKLKIQESFDKISKVLLTLTSCYVAYTWGTNDVANATALVSSSGALPIKMAVLIGGIGMFLGAVLFGAKVASNVGFNITRITPAMGICADLSAAITIHFFTQIKIPVSTTHALVGAIVGVGLVRGSKMVNLRIARDIAIAWVITPVVSGIVSFCLYHVVKGMMPL